MREKHSLVMKAKAPLPEPPEYREAVSKVPAVGLEPDLDGPLIEPPPSLKIKVLQRIADSVARIAESAAQ